MENQKEHESRESASELARKMKGMKQSEFEPCLLCGKGMAHNNDLDFYRITFERFMIDYGAAQRQYGMELSMGAAAGLAQFMGPDEDMAKLPSPQPSFLVCGRCAMDQKLPIALISEQNATRDEEV